MFFSFGGLYHWVGKHKFPSIRVVGQWKKTMLIIAAFFLKQFSCPTPLEKKSLNNFHPKQCCIFLNLWNSPIFCVLESSTFKNKQKPLHLNKSFETQFDLLIFSITISMFKSLIPIVVIIK